MDSDNLKPFRDCLFDAIVSRCSGNPYNYEHMWAITEGIDRFDDEHRQFNQTRARNEHMCVRGCKIEKNEYYFTFLGHHWTSDLKICATCMAMILYFKDVDALPPYEYSHWDRDRNFPVLRGAKSRAPDFTKYINWEE